ncbi:MAG: 50S ribosomal protein L18e [Candidatus Woesearchaeota archaeon]
MKTNIQLTKLIEELKKQSNVENAKIWRRIADDLTGSTRRRSIVNLYKLNKHTKPDETVIVPGKVLSVGELDHKINIAAFNFSDQAKEKMLKAQCKILTIYELLKMNPKGKGVRIIG